MLKPLTTREIDAAKPNSDGKDRYLRDGNGLELRIRSSGKKTWQFRYDFHGKRKVLLLGDVHTHSLKAARVKAQEARTLLAEAKDPATYLNHKRAISHVNTQSDAPDSTPHYRLEDLLLAYAQWKEDTGKAAYAKSVRQYLQRYLVKVAPGLANNLASRCTPSEMADLLRPIYEKGAHRASDIFRSMLAAAFQAALQAPFNPSFPQSLVAFEITSNPVSALQSMPSQSRDRVLSQEELGQYAAYVLSHRSLLYHCMALSLFAGGQRPLQVARVCDADYDAREGILTLYDPKGKRKKPRIHIVPLGSYTRNMIEQWQKDGRSLNAPHWFSIDGTQVMESSSFSHQAMRIQKALDMAPFQLRDVRRTVETEMARLGFSKDLRAHLLSHGLGGVQDRHYDRYDRIDEKREALEKWEKHLLALMAPHSIQ